MDILRKKLPTSNLVYVYDKDTGTFIIPIDKTVNRYSSEKGGRMLSLHELTDKNLPFSLSTYAKHYKMNILIISDNDIKLVYSAGDLVTEMDVPDKLVEWIFENYSKINEKTGKNNIS